MDAWKTGLAGQMMTRSASLEGRKRGRPHTKLPVPDYVAVAGFSYRYCFSHGDVLTRSRPRITDARKVGLTDIENVTPQSRLCDHHAVDGSPQKISSYGYNEAVAAAKKIRSEQAAASKMEAEALRVAAEEEGIRLEEEQRVLREKAELRRRRSLRVESCAGSVLDRLNGVLGRLPPLSMEVGGVVDQLLGVIESLKEEVRDLRSSLEDERRSNSIEKAELVTSLTVLRDREEVGTIRRFKFTNELKYDSMEAITGVSAVVVSSFLAPIVVKKMPTIVDPATAVMWFLAYFRKSLSKCDIAFRSGVSRPTVARHIDDVASILSRKLLKYVQLPSIERWALSRTASLIEDFPNVLPMMIDATPLPIRAPTNPTDLRAAWNHKVSAPTLRWYLVVLPDGEIVWKSSIVDGSANDLTMYINSNFSTELSHWYKDLRDSAEWELAIFGDKGYRGAVAPPAFRFYLTESALKSSDQDDVMDAFVQDGRVLDTRVCKHRFVIERVFGQLKNRWRRLSSSVVFRGETIFMDKSIQVLCAIHNIVCFPWKYPAVYETV